ncbi:MAG: hypothetical protein K9N07_03475 [Candidatus Cloacimonetes bacterium]|nr:hypothetical protein [Candidatus Cloacimonadota bacterium]
MKNNYWLLLLIIFIISMLGSCSQKDPLEIKQVLMNDPDGHAPVLTNVQSLGDSILIEWYDNPPKDSEFRIYRQFDQNTFLQIAAIDSIYFEYFDTYEFTDSTNVTYYVETYYEEMSQESNHLHIIIEP